MFKLEAFSRINTTWKEVAIWWVTSETSTLLNNYGMLVSWRVVLLESKDLREQFKGNIHLIKILQRWMLGMIIALMELSFVTAYFSDDHFIPYNWSSTAISYKYLKNSLVKLTKVDVKFHNRPSSSPVAYLSSVHSLRSLWIIRRAL